MPYIDDETKSEVDEFGALNTGELNYELTMVCLTYLQKKKKSYQVLNDIMGALEGAKQEFYARVVRPYEDKKKEENGDVFES